MNEPVTVQLYPNKVILTDEGKLITEIQAVKVERFSKPYWRVDAGAWWKYYDLSIGKPKT